MQPENINTVYNDFVNTFTDLDNIHSPIKKVHIKNNNEYKPWFTKGLANACKKKNIYKKYLACKSMRRGKVQTFFFKIN